MCIHKLTQDVDMKKKGKKKILSNHDFPKWLVLKI